MNKSNFIRSFSIVESIVAMAVTAIIVGLVFVIFSIVSERMLDFQNQNRLINDFNRFTYSINKDIFENQELKALNNELHFKSYIGNDIKYEFSQDYILRKNKNFIDTFNLKWNKSVFDTILNESKNLTFQKIKLKIKLNEQEQELNFYKQIYANELLLLKFKK